MTFMPVYSYVDFYVSENDGHVLEGILVFEDLDSDGLLEAQYRYEAENDFLTVHGFDVLDFEEVGLIKQDMAYVLYLRRTDEVVVLEGPPTDVMWPHAEVLAHCLGHLFREQERKSWT